MGLLCEQVREVGATLVVLDSIGEAFAVDGVDENHDAEVAPWLRNFIGPLVATGAGVLPLDHGTKARDNPLHPSGSKRKRAHVQGAAYLVEAAVPVSKEAEGGRLLLTTAKDRHGNHRRARIAATVEIAIYPDGGWTWHVHPPMTSDDDPGANQRALARAVVRAVKDLADEMGAPPSQTAIEVSGRVKASAARIRGALEYA